MYQIILCHIIEGNNINRLITRELKKLRFEVMDWIYLVQDRNQWPPFGNTARNIRVP
jgi:hypothetical protein